MNSIANRARTSETVVDEEVVRLNVGFTINGTSNPLIAGNVGDELDQVQVTRVGAGHFTFTLRDTALAILGAWAGVGVSGGTTQMAANVDIASSPTTGAYIIWTQTAATATDPPTGSIVYVELALKTTNRKAIT